ncbi:MAG: PorP/SprF family type IX secretion system membrane protein [Ginsengibacter sp.]
MRNILLIILLFFSLAVPAQSYHFSQFYSAPLFINPALTGYIDGPYRIAGNIRSQWGTGGSPFTTVALSADAVLLKKHIQEGNTLGAGICVLNDKTLGGAVKSSTIGVSTAYNIVLDQDNIHTIGLGFQGIYNERRIDFSSLSFENQFGGSGFDPSLPIGESLPAGKTNYFDINVGSVYHMTLTDKSFFAGIGAYNVIRHKDNIQANEFRMPRRFTFIAGGQADVGYDGIFYFSMNYQEQSAAKELTVGAAYGIQVGLDKIQVINFGLWHRVKDAIIPYVGYQRDGFQAGFSFDYTISNLKTSSQVRNGFELSMIFTANDKSEIKKLLPWF